MLFVIFLVLCTCQKSEVLPNLIGKWYTLSTEEGYAELEIDSNEIKIYSEFHANLPHIRYTIDGDSIKYLNYDYSVGFRILSDTMIILSTSEIVDTLISLHESIITFHEIDYHNDSIFNFFHDQFLQRAKQCWINNVFGTEEEYEKSIIDFGDIEEEIIPINRK